MDASRPDGGARRPLLEALYAALALAGVIVPWSYNLAFMREHPGFDVAAFFAAGFVNPAAASLTCDLLIGATAFLVWMILEARRLGMRWWVYFLIANLIAFACACPLFLLMRERRLASLRVASGGG